MESVAAIFVAFGGSAAVARILNVGPSTASEMKRRASIPAEYWPELVQEASRRGIEGLTLESLATLYARAKGRIAPAALPPSSSDRLPRAASQAGA